MSDVSTFRLLALLVAAMSLVTFVSPNPPISPTYLRLGTVHANPSPMENWLPAGPAMDTLLETIFNGAVAEYTNLRSSSPSEDMIDLPVPSDLTSTFGSSGNYYLTPPTAVGSGFSEIEFNLANNFWGVNMNFGNNPTGVEIRQGIAHLIDKSVFALKAPGINGYAEAIDNPESTSSQGLPAPNPCGWDQSFVETGGPPNCQVGAIGGVAYHLAMATGVNFPWQPSLGSADFCAAATHFVNAGLAGGIDGTTCVLRGIRSPVTSHTVNFSIRNDNQALYALGQGIAQELCALFGNGFVTGCAPYLTVSYGAGSDFSVMITPLSNLNLGWWMYTSGFAGITLPNIFEEILGHLHAVGGLATGGEDPFDTSLYYVFNSNFTSVPATYRTSQSCSTSLIPSPGAPDYMYLCSPAYDTISFRMETAPCVSAQGDPTKGQTSPTFAQCPGTSSLTAISAGYQAEDMFGKAVYTLPIWSQSQQQAYLSNWNRVINSQATGTNNYFTWLDAYSPTPALRGVIRQGMGDRIFTLNPYDASTPYDFMILGNIYDSLGVTNPMSETQYIDWLAASSSQTPIPNSQLTYSPPLGTIGTYRYTLRGDVFFHDGRPLNSFDVAFSYLSLRALGAFQSAGASAMTGITVLSKSQFDINVNMVGTFVKIALGSLTMLPGHWWTSSSSWDSDVSACTSNSNSNSCFPARYSLTPTPSGNPQIVCSNQCAVKAADMDADPNKVRPTYDPISNNLLIGTGPWTCGTVDGTKGSGHCSAGDIMALGYGQSYSFQRFGIGTIPDSPPFNTYFRGSSTLALYLWTGDTGNFQNDFVNYTNAAACFNQPITSQPPCARWQQGIGGYSINSYGQTQPNVVGTNQVLAVNRFVGVNWVYPYNWFSSTGYPAGIAPVSPVLYEGISAGGAGNPFPAGTNQILYPASQVGCSQIYPVGGYDC